MLTLVIHLADKTTDCLKIVYEGSLYPVIRGYVARPSLKRSIQLHDRVFMLGHGSPGGLFGARYLIDDYFGEAIATRPQEGVYIWCSADQYAIRNKLSGFVTGMFISEVGEARFWGITATQKEVDDSNEFFCRTVRMCLDGNKGFGPQDIRAIYGEYASTAGLVAKFNAKRLYMVKNGVLTPERHEGEPSNYSQDLDYKL